MRGRPHHEDGCVRKRAAPAAGDFASFRAVKTHICSPVVVPFVPFQTLELPFPPETRPYFPFLRMAVNGSAYPFVPLHDPPPLGDRLAVGFPEVCGLGKVAGAPRGTSEFTVTLGIIDGPELVRQTALVEYDCAACSDTMPPPPTTSVDAGRDAPPAGNRTGGTPPLDRGCQCSFARRTCALSTSSLWPGTLLAGGTVLVWRRRRARSRRAEAA